MYVLILKVIVASFIPYWPVKEKFLPALSSIRDTMEINYTIEKAVPTLL